jgi:putative peptidoglycan lipid II flippase
MLFFVLSRLAGLAREAIIAARFGTEAELDTYQAAFRVPDFLFQMVAGGALGSAFIPVFSTFWERSDRQGAWLLFSRVLTLVTLLLSLLAALAAILALPLMRFVIVPGFAPAQQQLAAELMRWMLVSTVIFGASGLVMGALNGAHHFLAPAAAPLFYNLAIIAGAWWLSPWFGIHGLVIGVVAGAVAHLLVQLPSLWRQGARLTPSFMPGDPAAGEVMRLMGPRVLGLFFVQLHFLINTMLASGLDAGRISALGYAWMLMLLPQGVFAQAIATAAFPTFAAQIAANQTAAMRSTLSQMLRLVFFLTFPAAVGLLVMAQPIVQMLLQRNQFTSESTQLVAYALRFYAVGLLAHALLELIVRAFYALHDTWTPVIIGVIAMGLNILFSIWWVRYWEHGGLALANSVATTLEMCTLLLILQRRAGGIEEAALTQSALKSVAAGIAMGVFAWGWLRLCAGLPDWPLAQNSWLVGVGGITVAGLIYLTFGFLLNHPELRPSLRLLLRR